MRLMKRDQRQVVFRERITIKEPDATTYEDWSPDAITVSGSVQPAGGKVMAEMYGERLGNMLVMYSDDQKAKQLAEAFNSERKGFGALVYVAADTLEPDYRVVAVRPWRHTVIELEKVR